MHRDKATLVTAEGTSTHPYLFRLATLLAMPQIVLKPFPSRIDVEWLQKAAAAQSTTPLIREVYFEMLDSEAALGGAVSIDHWLIELCHQVRALAVVGRRNIFVACKRRLSSRPQVGDLWILNAHDLSTPKFREDLLNAGAIDWLLSPRELDAPGDLEPDGMSRHFELVESIHEAKEFLAHCTRTPALSHSAKRDTDRIDQLLFKRTRESTGPLSALIKILAESRIRASSDLTRSDRPVVCFTQHPIAKISELRTYRRHLGRWDFEPFGIAIRKKCLQDLGARQVIYGDPSDFEKLAIGDREFFQVAQSVIGHVKIDWRKEREWRLLDDLILDRIHRDDAFVFVPDLASAKEVAPFSRWPILIAG